MSKKTMPHKEACVLVVETINSNPNGDRDNNGAPRQNALTGLGEISDVCIKRWLREAVRILNGDVTLLIDNDRPLDEKIVECIKEATGMTLAEMTNAVKKDRNAFQPVKELLLQKYFDLRAFGGTITTVPNQGIKGPVQFTISQSVLPVVLKTFALTSKGIATEKQFYGDGSNTMFGEKTVVRHGVYIIKGEFSAWQAQETGFTKEDKDKLLNAMVHMFDFNKSAARADMRLRALYDFEYPDLLGLEPETKALWDAVKVTPVPDVQAGIRPATQFSDYVIALDEAAIPESVTVHKLV